jgi:hypothetical protein
MKPQFQQRHQDYVVGPNQDARLASIAAGATISNIQFQTDPDVPFLLRGYCYRVAYDTIASHTQVGIQNVKLRISGPDEDSRGPHIPQNLIIPFGGQSQAWRRVYPNIFYPSRSTITIDLVNTGSATLTNFTLYLRGVKLYSWGINPEYTYPKRCRMINYVYPINFVNLSTANPTGAIQNLLTADVRRAQPFTSKPDSDFALRALQAGPSYSPLALEVFMMLRDENQKAYSNDWVHFEVLAGPSTGNYQTGSAGSVTAIGTGNSMPGIIFPEIYVPAQHLLYYDIMRSDSGYGGAQTISNFPVNLLGSRVYAA